MADDWYFQWQIAQAGTFWEYFAQYYVGWSGRVVQTSLIWLAVSTEISRQIFQILTVVCFLLFSAAAYYLGTGQAPLWRRAEWHPWLLTAALLWLGLPVVNETIVQTTGAATYLWPSAMGLGVLCLFRAARDRAEMGQVTSGGWGLRLGWFVAGAVVGACNEQLFAGMVTVLFGWGIALWRVGKLRSIPGEAWFGLAGLAIGALLLVAAPGNYARLLQPQNENVSLISMLIRFGLYVGGAYFSLGTGDAGRSLWLGIAVVALSGVFTPRGTRGRDAAIWCAASLATLGPMLPLVNFAAPRTTFLPVTFLFIAALTAFPRKADSERAAASWLVGFAIAMLLVIDGLVGWTANRSLKMEMASRIRIIESAAASGQKEVVVPYLATIPSRLTAMLNPEHDAEFVSKLARWYGLNDGRHDDSATAPRPQTLNTLKALKNSF